MNTSPSYTILITGLGALGTVFATLMKKAGHRVFALARENCRCAISDGQVRVTGIWGEHEARLDGIYSSIDPLKGDFRARERDYYQHHQGERGAGRTVTTIVIPECVIGKMVFKPRR